MGNEQVTQRPQARNTSKINEAPIKIYRDEYLWKIPVVGDIGSGKVKTIFNNYLITLHSQILSFSHV